jgi:hypothetical protein
VNIREGKEVFIKFHEVVKRGSMLQIFIYGWITIEKGPGGLLALKTSFIVVVAVVLRPSRLLA